MKVDELFPSRFIKGEDVMKGKDGRVTLTLRSLTIEEMGKDKERNPVLWFNGTDKGLVLGKTNAMTLKKLYGNESDDWAGKRITLTTERVNAFGGWHDSVVVVGQVPPAPASKAQPAAPTNGKKQYESWDATEYRRRIVELSNRHDSLFMTTSDVSELREMMMAVDNTDDVMSVANYEGMCDEIDSFIGSNECANNILTYVFGRVIGKDTMPGGEAGATLWGGLTDHIDALRAVFSVIKQGVKAS